eukprot:scaffold3112_cov70-Cylindrotheca_fusiformis.AAC.1
MMKAKGSFKMQYGVEPVVPIESIYTEDSSDKTKKLTDYISAIYNGAGIITTDEQRQDVKETAKKNDQ